MDDIISKLTGIVLKPPIRGDDFVDRLHYFVTVAILFLFTFGAGLQEYVGKPINCWTPADIGGSDTHEHINEYCWTHKLRYPNIPRDSVLYPGSSTSFLGYQKPQPLVEFGTAFFRWVTVVFIVQACLFKLPNFLWQQLSISSGADLEKIRDLVLQAQSAETEDARRLKMDGVVAYFETWITGYRSYRIRLAGKHSAKVLSVLFCLGKRSGNFLSSLYISIKILNVINVIGNIFLLTVFLDVNFWKYGLKVLHSVINFGDWQDPDNFPRLLLCDFIVEGGKGNASEKYPPMEYQVQCTMTMNLLLEKIFVLEWFWLFFLLIMTMINLVSWGVKIKPPCSTILFSKTYIKNVQNTSVEVGLATIVPVQTAPDVPIYIRKEFIEEYIRSDGVFVLRLLELNADRTLVGDVVKHLWERYRAVHCFRTSLQSLDNGKLKANERDNSDVHSGEDESHIVVVDSSM